MNLQVHFFPWTSQGTIINAFHLVNWGWISKRLKTQGIESSASPLGAQTEWLKCIQCKLEIAIHHFPSLPTQESLHIRSSIQGDYVRFQAPGGSKKFSPVRHRPNTQSKISFSEVLWNTLCFNYCGLNLWLLEAKPIQDEMSLFVNESTSTKRKWEISGVH